jgi:hypothetical protein
MLFLTNFLIYKALLLIVPMILFGMVSGLSGTQFYQDPLLLLYHVVFTLLPVILVVVEDNVHNELVGDIQTTTPSDIARAYRSVGLTIPSPFPFSSLDPFPPSPSC